MSAQPTRLSTTQASESREDQAIGARFRWPAQVMLRAGVLEDPATGDRFEITQTAVESQILVNKITPTRVFSVLTETSSPLLSIHGDETTASSVEISAEAGFYPVGESNVTQAGRLRRRLEEHRVEVEQLRRKIGDPMAALERFMVENFDGKSIRSIFVDSSDNSEQEGSSEIDAQEGH